MRLLLLFILITGCGYLHKGDKPEEETPTPEYVLIYKEAKSRLFQNHIENGWVVSRWADGSPEHEGEGLLWTGTLLTVLSCQEGENIEDKLIAMVRANNGSLVRVSPLGEYRDGREITYDGVIGLYRGISSRLARCPSSLSKWRVPWRLHLDALDANEGRFHPNAPAKTPPGFSPVQDLITEKLGLGDGPSDVQIGVMVREISVWAAGVVLSKKPAYRLNLGFLHMQVLEDMGRLGDYERNLFCANTGGADVPLIDHWCGRKDIAEYIDTFEFNKWEYRHQRSGKWEKPDGKPGLSTPGLDLLVALVAKYDLIGGDNGQ